MQNAQVCRVDSAQPLILCILHTYGSPTGVFWQEAPIWWIHSHSHGQKTLTYYPEAVAGLALLGLKFSVATFGYAPAKLIVPYTKEQVEILAGIVDAWAVLVTSFNNVIDNHYPQNKLLSFMLHNVVYFPKITSNEPLVDALLIFTDVSKT